MPAFKGTERALSRYQRHISSSARRKTPPLEEGLVRARMFGSTRLFQQKKFTCVTLSSAFGRSAGLLIQVLRGGGTGVSEELLDHLDRLAFLSKQSSQASPESVPSYDLLDPCRASSRPDVLLENDVKPHRTSSRRRSRSKDPILGRSVQRLALPLQQSLGEFLPNRKTSSRGFRLELSIVFAHPTSPQIEPEAVEIYVPPLQTTDFLTCADPLLQRRVRLCGEAGLPYGLGFG